jgi:uncharacterized protein (UPF0332 family)
MNFSWNDYLSLAMMWGANLEGNAYPHAIYRSLISRVYYAVFHAAVDVAQDLGLQTTRSASDHYRVRKFFATRGRVAAQLNHTMMALYNLRISADYEIIEGDLVTDDPQAAAQKALELAQKAMQSIAYLKPKS